ncbi:MAG: response regulator [Candidatus Omnitrophota bacterium]
MKKKILVIDDEKDFLTIVSMNLEETGKYEVKTSENANNIIQYLRDFKPDLILLDLMMPGVGGLSACETLNNDDVGKKTPIIILSALDKDRDKLEAYKKGVVDYLVKPIDKDELIKKIEKALEYK